MKTTHKKRKKRGSRKTDTLRSGSDIVSKPDSVSVITEKEMKRKDRQVISKSSYEKDLKVGNAILRYINIAIQFLRDSRMELKKVKWPTRKELLASTSMVVILVLAIALFLGIIDLVLLRIITKIVG
jgi:preprotein translocase subunit SecE